jgi:prepilin-type N-terminal cleavage/methylation domain-containing protein
MKHVSAYRFGFTLIEVLIVIVLLGIFFVGGFTVFTSVRNNQLVRQSAEMVADTFQRASIYSQNAREERTWGVKSDNQKQYMIVSRHVEGEEFSEYQVINLPSGIQFTRPFHIWFTRGTGAVDTDIQVVLSTVQNETSIVSISTSGKIDVLSP